MKMFHFQFYHSISKANIDPNLSVLDTNQRFLLIYIFLKNWAIFSAPVHWFCTFQISFQHELHARTFRKSFHHPAYKTSCPLINYSNNKTQTSQTHPFPLCFHSFIYYHFFFLNIKFAVLTPRLVPNLTRAIFTHPVRSFYITSWQRPGWINMWPLMRQVLSVIWREVGSGGGGWYPKDEAGRKEAGEGGGSCEEQSRLAIFSHVCAAYLKASSYLGYFIKFFLLA